MCFGESSLVVAEMEAKREVIMTKKKPAVLFCLGPPGSGKGTQCERIVEHYSFIHLSAGDCLREAQINNDDTSKLIDHYIREGLIVPVEITIKLLRKKMQEHGWYDNYFLIDGFPRNQNNMKGWFDNVSSDEVEVLGCLFLNCPDDIVVERLLKRGKTSGRTDDNKETIVKRLKVYHEETMPIVKYFKEINKCFTIDASPPIDEVWKTVRTSIEEIIYSEPSIHH